MHFLLPEAMATAVVLVVANNLTFHHDCLSFSWKIIARTELSFIFYALHVCIYLKMDMETVTDSHSHLTRFPLSISLSFFLSFLQKVLYMTPSLTFSYLFSNGGVQQCNYRGFVYRHSTELHHQLFSLDGNNYISFYNLCPMLTTLFYCFYVQFCFLLFSLLRRIFPPSSSEASRAPSDDPGSHYVVRCSRYMFSWIFAFYRIK